MQTDKKIIVVGLTVSVVALILITYFVWWHPGKKPVGLATRESPAAGPVNGTENNAKQEIGAPKTGQVTDPLDLDLNNSDDTVRQFLRDCSGNMNWLGWIRQEKLVRCFVYSVSNIAEGESPASHLNFIRLPARFAVIERDEKILLDPRSYNRYNALADACDSLDTGRCFRLYSRLIPTLEKAFKELGLPREKFSGRLNKAISILLQTPVSGGDIQLQKNTLSYSFVSPTLEELNAPQKHLLRMGPENIKKIQQKLREFQALVLGR